MKTIDSRIRKLEERFGTSNAARMWVVTNAAVKLALNEDRCVQILYDCGFLPPGRLLPFSRDPCWTPFRLLRAVPRCLFGRNLGGSIQSSEIARSLV